MYIVNCIFIKCKADGSKYEGNYFEGKKHGNGIYTWVSNDKYEGEWKDN